MHCAECEQITTEMRKAFLKLMTHRPGGDLPTREDFNEFIARLFASEKDLARLSELYNQSEFGVAHHKWIDHRIATGHTGTLLSAMN